MGSKTTTLRRYLNEGLFFDYQDDLEREGMEPDSAFPPVRIVSHPTDAPTTADTCWKCNQPGTPSSPPKTHLHGTFQHDLSCNPEVHA